MVVISLLNRKGGVAKTTSTMNLAAELHHRGLSVLCVDLDPQATLSLFAGERPPEIAPEGTVLAALLPEQFELDARALNASAPWGGLLWRASADLVQAEVTLSAPSTAGPHRRLAVALSEHARDRDLVLVDSPPSLGKLVLNALGAADFLLIPVACDFASLGGLDQLFRTVELFRRYERPEIEVLGIFGTGHRRTRHADESIQALAEQTGKLLMQTRIPMSVQVQDAQAARQALRQYAPDSKAGITYWELAGELLERLAERGVRPGKLRAVA